MYYNFESYVAVRRSFLTIIVHQAKNLPSISTLRYLMKTFERAGGAKYFWKGKKLDSKEETVKCVACLYAARQRLSLRRESEKLEISRQKYMEFFAKTCLRKLIKRK